MKNKLTILFALFLGLAFAVPAEAVVVSTEKSTVVESNDETTTTSTAMTKKEARKMKRLAKIQKKLKKWGNGAIDFDDPVKKWMWFWILGWALGLVLSVLSIFTLGFLGWVGWAAWTFGSVALIIWIVKMIA